MGFRYGRGRGAAAALFQRNISFPQQFGFLEGEGQTNITVTMQKQNERSEGIDYEVLAPLSSNPDKELNLLCLHLFT